MITSKQRAYLRSLSNDYTAIVQVGKSGLTENLVTTVREALEARELIKLSVLDTCAYTPREICDILASEIGAEGVSVVGRKVVLYKESAERKRIVLPNL